MQVVVDYNYRRSIQNLLNMFVQGGNVFQESFLILSQTKSREI